MLPSSSLIESRLNTSINGPDPDTEVKVRSSMRTINDTIQWNANEPSLALYRIQVNEDEIIIVELREKNYFKKIFLRNMYTKHYQ